MTGRVYGSSRLKQVQIFHLVWMADRIIKNGGQANPICFLCRHTRPETNEHMLATCSLFKEVWTELQQPLGLTITQSGTSELPSIEEMVDGHDQPQSSNVHLPETHAKKDVGRVFDSRALTLKQLATALSSRNSI